MESSSPIVSNPVAPAITTQPTGRRVLAGSATTFTVVATGNPFPSYAWRKDGVEITGATDSTFVVTEVLPEDAGSYDVVVSNVSGSVTGSAVTLTVDNPETLEAPSNVTVTLEIQP
jgi:hypothetical protein